MTTKSQLVGAPTLVTVEKTKKRKLDISKDVYLMRMPTMLWCVVCHSGMFCNVFASLLDYT